MAAAGFLLVTSLKMETSYVRAGRDRFSSRMEIHIQISSSVELIVAFVLKMIPSLIQAVGHTILLAETCVYISSSITACKRYMSEGFLLYFHIWRETETLADVVSAHSETNSNTLCCCSTCVSEVCAAIC